MSLNENILRSLRRIIRATDLHSRRLASEHQLTTPQLLCLRLLDEEGPLTAGKLAKEMFLSQATITGVLDRLEKRGLLTRQRDLVDRRKVNVHLTPEGVAAVKKAPLPLHERFAARLETLDQEQRNEIDRVLTMIVRMMEAQEIDVVPMIASGEVEASLKQADKTDPDNKLI